MADPTVDPGGIAGYVASAIAALGSAFVGWRMIKKDASNSAVTEASNDANIEAITTYKELVKTERDARAAAEVRADKFAEERNNAQRELYIAMGTMEALRDQIMNLNNEVQKLRSELQALRAEGVIK